MNNSKKISLIIILITGLIINPQLFANDLDDFNPEDIFQMSLQEMLDVKDDMETHWDLQIFSIKII